MTPALRAEIRAQYPAKTIMQIADEYGLGYGTIYAALQGLTRHRGTHGIMLEEDVLEMRAAYPQMTIAQIANKWGYGETQVHAAVTGRSFKHLPCAHSGNNQRGWTDKHPKRRQKINAAKRLAATVGAGHNSGGGCV